MLLTSIKQSTAQTCTKWWFFQLHQGLKSGSVTLFGRTAKKTNLRRNFLCKKTTINSKINQNLPVLNKKVTQNIPILITVTSKATRLTAWLVLTKNPHVSWLVKYRRKICQEKIYKEKIFHEFPNHICFLPFFSTMFPDVYIS